MSPHIIVLAAALKVAIPTFTLDQAPGVFATSMSNELAKVIDTNHCGTPLAAAQFNEEFASSFRICNGQASCLIVAGRGLGIDLVLAGHAKKDGDIYSITLTPIDARAGRIRPAQTFQATGKPTEIVKVFGQNADAICQLVDPEWKPVIKVVAKTEPPPPPAAKLDDPPLMPDFDLPDATPATPAPAPVAPTNAVTATPPVATSPAPPAVVTPPPPAVVAKDTTPPPAPIAKVETKPAAADPKVNLAAPEKTTTEPQVPTREVKNVPVAKPFPWVLVTGGGAVLTAAVGLGLGIGSHSIWSNDKPVESGGAVRHTITHADALSANRMAISANVLFGVAGALGVTTGVLILANGGLGLSGTF